ncbi:TonB-dependent siderophore receptor [Pseudomonas sp. M30-35]|uniref:TonB-dependent receptor n=1 Tax=Pseudomonas sp. M30-35 TaxID=1981174 RepID=UPI000B3C9781|nr:TonB-dependent siderophore receptor [Pseudomonas sp. M30-35]ARU89770.1 TonB-dependent siderophore receptor [Pseudomonas sp. M30-35]
MQTQYVKDALPLPRLASARLASAIGFAIASCAGNSFAEQTSEKKQAVELDSVTVKGHQEDDFKVDNLQSPKYTAPLLDTPQTVTVISQAVIEDQAALSLRQVLSNVSGITFAAGEGGGGLGDSINIRGFSASSNILIDGLRDSAQTNRSDTFNLESVEVIKGPNSAYGGSGTTGGSINLVSKMPQARDFNRASIGLGTDQYQRLTADINQQLDGVPGAAFRLNLMGHQNGVAERDNIDQDRWGIAPSLTFGMGTDTQLNLSYFRQSDHDLPDYGLPASDGKVLSGVDRDNYYGFHNIDREETDTESFTVKLDHRFNDLLSLQNLTRFSEVDRLTVVSASHVNTSAPGLAPGQYVPAGPQGLGRDYNTKLAINQTNLTWNFNTGPLAHALVTGAEISKEKYDRTNKSYGLDFTGQAFDLYHPPGYYSGQTNKRDTEKVSSELDGRALYVIDTIELNEQWQLNASLRYDYLDGSAKSASIRNGVQAPSARFSTTDEELSSRLGVVYKPAPNGSIYLAWGNSFNPSAENIVGRGRIGRDLSEDDQNLDPEKNETWELGTKWELFGDRLAVNAAVFRVTKTDGRVASNDPLADPVVLDGKQRVDGIELGVAGKPTENWDIFANYTFLDSEILNAAPNDFAQEGQALANTPPRSFSLWNTYDVTDALQLGYGLQYMSERNISTKSTAKVDDYVVHSAMAAYQINDEVDVQLNVRNLFNEEYYDRVRTSTGSTSRSSSLVPGEGRTAIASVNFAF